MNFYWLYDLSAVGMFALIVGFITFGGLAKTLFFPDFFERKWNITKDSNDFVIAFLTLTGAFLSITLGLIAVGTFDTYNASEDKVSAEANALTTMYQTVEMLEQPSKTELKTTLKQYTKYVIDSAWPLQRQGIVPTGGSRYTDIFLQQLSNYQPANDREFTKYGALLDQYNQFVEKRRLRLEAVKSGLPTSVYVVLIIGLLINMLISWQIKVDNRPLEIFTSLFTGILAGALVYIIVSMDHPFRGHFSISADAFKSVLEGVMK